jgi:hypothetical protein
MPKSMKAEELAINLKELLAKNRDSADGPTTGLPMDGLSANLPLPIMEG